MPATIADLDGLQRELRVTRERGWAEDNEENEPGTRCVGAPVFDYRDVVVAALSVAWEAPVHPELEYEDVARFVIEAARGLSHRLGYGAGQRVEA